MGSYSISQNILEFMYRIYDRKSFLEVYGVRGMTEKKKILIPIAFITRVCIRPPNFFVIHNLKDSLIYF